MSKTIFDYRFSSDTVYPMLDFTRWNKSNLMKLFIKFSKWFDNAALPDGSGLHKNMLSNNGRKTDPQKKHTFICCKFYLSWLFVTRFL